MIRRRMLWTAAAVAAGAWWLRPADRGGPPDERLAALARALADVPQQPVLVLDRARWRANLARIRRLAHAALPLRVVAKSLPCAPLLDEALRVWNTQRAMVFNARQAELVAQARPDADLLLGKPLPASAAHGVLPRLARARLDAPRQVQWLVDTPERLAEYRALARAQGVPLGINIEIDVGLHRGGVESTEMLAAMLDLLRDEPLLPLRGFMGYDAHLASIPDLPGNRERALAHARERYATMVALARERLHTDGRDWTLNTAGSPTLHLHDDQHTPNELAVGSAAVKPSHFDLPSLAELEPALFIATPILKVMERFRLPVGAEPISDAVRWWDVNQRQGLAIHGGHWLADPVHPQGVASSGLYGPSSNQQVMVASPSTPLAVGDWMLWRPWQSEAVMTQFDTLCVVDDGKLQAQWPVMPVNP